MAAAISQIQEPGDDKPDDLDNAVSESNDKNLLQEKREQLQEQKGFQIKVNFFRFFLVVAFIALCLIGFYYGIKELANIYNYFRSQPAAPVSAPASNLGTQAVPASGGNVILGQPGSSGTAPPGPVKSNTNVIPVS